MEPLRSSDPRRVGRFHLLCRLGEGGMGVVFLAAAWTGRRVAVKLIHEDLVADPVARARFAREARAARAVTGIFTAAVLRADVDAERPWIATEYLPGVSLAEAVEVFADGLPLDTVRSLGAAMAEALADIHRRGVVHRDLTPRNVMLTADGPRVIDFGISRISGERPITRPASVLGTRSYVAPERFRGGDAHPSADVYALGACLAFAATGAPPATGAAAEAIGDTELSDLVASCLDPSPGSRPTAAELLRRLGGAPVWLRGNAWLPEAIAALIRSRAERARDLTGAAASADEAPRGRADTTEARPRDPAKATETGPFEPTDAAEAGPRPAVEATETGPTAPGATQPGASGRTAMGRRALLVGGAAAVVAGATVWLSRATRPAATISPADDAASGPPPKAKRAWETRVGNSYPNVKLARNTLLVATVDHLIGLDPDTGDEKWRRATEVCDWGVDHGYIYRSSGTAYEVKAVDLETGRTDWSFPLDLNHISRVTQTTASRAYVTGDKVYALDTGDGGTRWSAEVKPQKDVALALDASDDVVLVAGERLVALSAHDGHTRWSRAAHDQALLSPVIGDQLALWVDKRFNVYALDARDGSKAWTLRSPPMAYPPVYGGDRVFIAQVDGYVVARSARDARRLWRRRLGHGEGKPYWDANMIGLSGDTLLVGGTDHTVYAVDAADGRVLWTYGAATSHTNPPVAGKGLVFIAMSDGSVRALNPPR